MHCIQALIGPAEILAAVKERFSSAVLCPLAQGMALVPITDRLADALASIGPEAGEALLT